ncbi:MAG: methyltransferase domain-containing protein [Methylococcales bacterium]
MLPFVKARNVRCSHCNSLPRHRLFYLVADRVLDLFSKSLGSVIHFAPEKCLQDFLRRKSSSYFGVDIKASPLVNLIADAQLLPIADHSVDFLYSCHVLEHVPDDQRAMHEISRVLKPGGVATIMVPLHGGYKTKNDPAIRTPEQRNKRYGNPNHLRYYGDDVRAQLESTGLEIERYSAADVVSEKDTRYYRLQNDVVFICRRPVG